MLKRLELVGFKSFADKTRFDFAAGITAVVGPNGSGKSNIVDAVKWVLGEQSAKSLRGGEMADVIFNGSASRKSLGMAEVTMTFDNSRRVLAVEAEEVQIGRRVYRDGTGEYLINNQIGRLKDIKDLFLGSGAGTSAYSIIEQGRVDALLQASTRDRRIILEEAAGISRFKAKKLETLRKLERVDQNLARLRDIIAEVEGQLRRVRMEASKAQRYQEYSQRLRELRVSLGLRDFDRLSERRAVEQADLEALRSGLTAAQVQAGEWEAEAQALEDELACAEANLETTAEQIAGSRQRIAALESDRAHDVTKCAEIEEELAATRRRRLDLVGQLRTLTTAVAEAGGEVQDAESAAAARRQRVAEISEEVAFADAALDELQQRVQLDRAEQVDLVRRAGTLQTQADNSRSQLERLHRERDQRHRRIEQKAAERDSVERVLAGLSEADADLQEQLGSIRAELAERQQGREALRRLAEHLQSDLTDLQVRRSDFKGRIEILENLERSQEGLGTGVREVVAILNAECRLPPAESRPELDSACGIRHSALSLSDAVVGLVADVLSVPRELAPLIDLALGETAQRFVVRNTNMLERILRERPEPFAGRVSFLPLIPLEPLAHGDDTPTADRWVTCDHPELGGLPRQLLGNVRIVADLAEARRLVAEPECAGLRFITRAGELLEPDGTLTVGRHHADAGILSRKSELRDLRVQLSAIETDVAATEARLTDLRGRIDGMDAPIHGLEQEVALLADRAGDLQSQIVQHRQHRGRLDDELTLYRAEFQLLEAEIESLDALCRDTRLQAEEAERASTALSARMEETDRVIRSLEQGRVRLQEEHTAAKIAFAQMDERLGAQRERHRQLAADLARGGEEAHRIERHEGVLDQRWRETQLAMLAASSNLAESFHGKELQERRAAELFAQRDADRERRRALLERLNSARAASQEQLSALHGRELALRDLHNELKVLADRLREDYGVDLEQLHRETREAGTAPASADDAESATREIAELRERITRLGKNVNLDSIQELADVEARAKDLTTQHDDLTQAQAALQEIIAKINTDSRKLFSETYETVRGHFQELFRRLFGGGMADVVLEDPNDVLESGIEIVARPPGKELRSISLLSGGEKTLTAVALLLAIFRSKPSPFCLLDEVDAALDEANTARLASVVRDFLDHSQFIIITHKKRTMAAADVLYGITMQESGISKQVSVQFEDWPDEEAERQAA